MKELFILIFLSSNFLLNRKMKTREESPRFHISIFTFSHTYHILIFIQQISFYFVSVHRFSFIIRFSFITHYHICVIYFIRQVGTFFLQPFIPFDPRSYSLIQITSLIMSIILYSWGCRSKNFAREEISFRIAT